MPKQTTWPVRAVFGIAAVTIRDALRSRLLGCLGAVVIAIVLGLALTLEGDGTAAGRLRVLLGYSFGGSAVLLGTAAIWVSCGAIARDVSGRQIQLVAVKPVRRYQIWLGKWLGLLMVHALLLCLVAATVYAAVQWCARPALVGAEARRELAEQVLVGRRRVKPRPDPIEETVRAQVERLAHAGKIPAHMTSQQAADLIRKRLLAERSATPPGRAKEWVLDVPARKPSRNPIAVRFRFTSPARARQPVTGSWTIRTPPPARPDAAALPSTQGFSVTVSNRLDGVHHFVVDGAAVPAAGGPVTLKFTNAGREQSTTVLFDPYRGVEMLIRESSFEWNLVRAAIVIFCHLAFLSALGLTAGALFSLPVATFVSSSVLAATLMTHYFNVASSPEHDRRHLHGPVEPPSVALVAARKLIAHLGSVVEPTVALNPIGLVSDGILVSWNFTGRAVLRLLLVYPALLQLLAVAALSRREFALPAQGAG